MTGRRNRARGRAAAGFTLLEMLVALVILGFIVTALAGSTALGFAAQRVQAQAQQSAEALQPVDGLLRRLVAGMALPDDPHQPGLAGERGGFVCITADPAPGTADPALTDRWDASVATDPLHRLVLRWTPHRHAEALGPPASPREAVLLQNLQRLELSYLAPDRSGWLPAWSRADLPALVRIQLVFPPGDPRHWPPIVAATRQGRSPAGVAG